MTVSVSNGLKQIPTHPHTLPYLSEKHQTNHSWPLDIKCYVLCLELHCMISWLGSSSVSITEIAVGRGLSEKESSHQYQCLQKCYSYWYLLDYMILIAANEPSYPDNWEIYRRWISRKMINKGQICENQTWIYLPDPSVEGRPVPSPDRIWTPLPRDAYLELFSGLSHLMSGVFIFATQAALDAKSRVRFEDSDCWERIRKKLLPSPQDFEGHSQKWRDKLPNSCVWSKAIPKNRDMKKMKVSFFHQRPALSTRFDIFVITYRVT